MTSRRGYEVVGWTKGVWDTAKPGVEAIVRRTIGGFRPGGILLLHDADGSGEGDDRSQTVEAVPEIVERAHAAGYELVTVSELADARARQAHGALAHRRRARALRRAARARRCARVDISTVDAVDIAWWWVLASLGRSTSLSILLKAVVWKAALDTIPGTAALPLRARRAGALHRLPAQHAAARAPRRDRAHGGAARRLHAGGHRRPDADLAGSVVAEQIVLASRSSRSCCCSCRS